MRSRVALAAMLLLVACGDDDPSAVARASEPVSVQIAAVTTSDGARELVLHVLGTPAGLDEDDACFEAFEADVVESADRIEVQVFRVVEADYSGGCENVDRTVAAPLEADAGDRPVVDRHDGRTFTLAADGRYTTPEVCGLEDLACQGEVPPTTAVPATCSTASYRYAVSSEIDGGSYGISNARCDGTWAAFDVDFGRDACLPEADADDPCRGSRVHRTFWRNVDGRWRILSYQGSGDCAEARAADPAFPEEICAPPAAGAP